MSNSIKKILVPLDGSKNSFRGLDEAIYLARQCHATVTATYVIPIYPRNLADAIMPYQIHLTKEAKKYMSSAKLRAAKQGVLLKSKIIYGSPSSEIPDMAKNNKFDLIVIGSRGMGSVKELFLGSTSNYVLHKSPIPVLIVK